MRSNTFLNNHNVRPTVRLDNNKFDVVITNYEKLQLYNLYILRFLKMKTPQK